MIRKYLILLYFFNSSPVLAADSLGRLFHTPEQRAQMDLARVKRDQRLPVSSETEPAAAPIAQGPDVVTYSGVVRRSDGKSTVWINGKPVNERNRIGNASEVNVLGVRRDGAVSVAIPQADRRASLKVGQSLDVTSGRIEESYARRMTLPRPIEDAVPAPAAPPPAMPSALAPAASSATASTRPTRPVRESAFKESDPESGAVPAERVLKK